jgi:hypothetical protein
MTKTNDKHTPAPWLVTKDRWGALCVNNHESFASEFPIAVVNGAGDDERAANAALIAAAPDLLKSLERWQTFARDNNWTDADYQSGGIGWITEMNAAIAKVEGR